MLLGEKIMSLTRYLGLTSMAIDTEDVEEQRSAADRVGIETTLWADSSHGAGSEESGGSEELHFEGVGG